MFYDDVVYCWINAGCGHCKRLAPAYEQVGDAFANEKGVLIAKVDADGDRELGSRFGVRGFPTLKFFPKGSTEPEEYVLFQLLFISSTILLLPCTGCLCLPKLSSCLCLPLSFFGVLYYDKSRLLSFYKLHLVCCCSSCIF